MKKWIADQLYGVIVIFYMTEDSTLPKDKRNTARITVKKVSVRKTSTIKRTHLSNGIADDASQ